MLSSEYGWTTEYILSRTAREIFWRLNSIRDRVISNRKIEASLHGMEYRMPESAPVIDDERRDLVEEAIRQRMALNGGRQN